MPNIFYTVPSRASANVVGGVLISSPTYVAQNTPISSGDNHLSYATSDYSDASKRPYLRVKYYTGSSPNYTIQIKWYDDPTAGSLLRTDSIFTENGVTIWNSRNSTIVSPTNAQSFEVIISATTGAEFNIDDIDIHSLGLSKTLSFKPELTSEDGLGNSYVTPPPSALVSVSSQSVADSSDTTMSFNTETKDTNSIWTDSSPTKLICKTAGLYKIFGSVHPASDADGIRKVSIEHSSAGTLADVILSNASIVVDNSPNIPIEISAYLEIDDELTLHFYHTAGSSLNVDATFGMVYYGGSA